MQNTLICIWFARKCMSHISPPAGLPVQAAHRICYRPWSSCNSIIWSKGEVLTIVVWSCIKAKYHLNIFVITTALFGIFQCFLLYIPCIKLMSYWQNEPNIYFLDVVQQTNTIFHLFEKQFSDTLLPLVSSSPSYRYSPLFSVFSCNT